MCVKLTRRRIRALVRVIAFLPFLAAWAARADADPSATSTTSDEVVVESFKVPNYGGALVEGDSISVSRWRSGLFDSSSLRIRYWGDSPAHVKLPFGLSGVENKIRIWLRCGSAAQGAFVRFLLEDRHGTLFGSPDVRLQADSGWQPIEIELANFQALRIASAEADPRRSDWLLVQCSGGFSQFEIDDLTAIGADNHDRQRLLAMREGDIVIDNTSEGHAWWATLAAQYDPIQHMTESTSPNAGRRGMNISWWTLESERIKKIGLQAVRMWFQIDWWEPVNDDENPGSWEPGFTGFDTEGPRMQSVYKFLDLCQMTGTEVQLNFGWKLDLPTRYWLATDQSVADESPDIRDAEEHAESLVSVLTYLRSVMGYTVITHLSLGNEFEYNYPDLYQAVHERLIGANQRQSLKLMGFESNQGMGRSIRFARQHPGVLDVHTLHYNVPHNSVRGMVKRNAGRGSVHYSEFCLGPASGVEIADAVLSFAEEGAYGCGGWRLADQHLVSPIEQTMSGDRFDAGLHQWGTWNWIPWMRRPRESYFAASLLMRYTWAHSRVFGMPDSEGHGEVRAVCFIKGDEATILAVNRSSEPRAIRIELKQPVLKRFNRHLFSKDGLDEGYHDTIIPSDRWFSSSTLSDSLPAESFAIYTTMPDWPQIEVVPPLVLASPDDTVSFAARQIATEGAVNWSVDGGLSNGTITAEGLYRAPTEMPNIDPVLVRATGADERAVGLAVVLFSGLPEAQVSRPTVVKDHLTSRRGGGRIFDLGDVSPDRVRTFRFKMVNHGPESAPFLIESSRPWVDCLPARGVVPSGGEDSISVEVQVDPRGLVRGRWQKATVSVVSPRGAGCEVLDVIFRVTSQTSSSPQR